MSIVQNTPVSSINILKAAKSTLIKTVFLSAAMLALGSATAYAEDYPEYPGLTLETVTVKGDHHKDDTITLTYKDAEGKKIVKSTAKIGIPKVAATATPTSFQITPNVSTGWDDKNDATVCSLSKSKCEVSVYKNGIKSKLTMGDLDDPLKQELEDWSIRLQYFSMGMKYADLDNIQPNDVNWDYLIGNTDDFLLQLRAVIGNHDMGDHRFEFKNWDNQLNFLAIMVHDLRILSREGSFPKYELKVWITQFEQLASRTQTYIGNLNT
jgi:hypothetical protein